MQLIGETSADAGRIARVECAGCCSVVRRNTDRCGESRRGRRGRPRASSCNLRRPPNATPRSTGFSIAAPPCAPLIPKAARRSSSSAAPHRSEKRSARAHRAYRSTPVFACSPRQPRRATSRLASRRSIGNAPANGTSTRRHLGCDHRLRHCAARRSAAEPHPRLQGFRQRRSHCRSTTAATARTSPASSPEAAHSRMALYAGIAPEVDIVALRVLGDDCRATPAT